MKEEYRIKLLEALKSGQYKKGIGALITEQPEGEPDLFCCLGVCQNILVEEGFFDYEGKIPTTVCWDTGGLLPSIRNYLEMDMLEQKRLIDLNDLNPNDNFAAIINYLERQAK